MTKSCRTCIYLRVRPDKDGKRRIRADNSYPCDAPLPTWESLKLPASVQQATSGWSNGLKWPPTTNWMEPDKLGEEMKRVDLVLAGCEPSPQCVRTEKKEIVHPAWMQLMPVGSVLVPIFWPETKTVEDVCVEWKPK